MRSHATLRGWAFAITFLALCWIGAMLVTWRTIPLESTSATRFDAILVLGYPSNEDGSPSPEMRERVMEGIREFRAGRAGRLIMTGGAAHNRFVEGQVMAQLALEQGIPADDVVVEGQSQNTIQNIYFSDRILKARGWRTVEVVSSPSHLPRAALILSHYRFGWKMRAAPWPPEYPWWRRLAPYLREVQGTAGFRWFGLPTSQYLPVR
jgi:uncharacterized SAM-binding protein YcdF (DUF218 family)